jgi:H/ACA ribonucleoprotein complex non-core subunit NAF1
LSKKGCDASNIYDEEIPEKDQEFSDDEKEREFKAAKKKNKKKNKNLEEGEIDDSTIPHA